MQIGTLGPILRDGVRGLYDDEVSKHQRRREH